MVPSCCQRGGAAGQSQERFTTLMLIGPDCALTPPHERLPTRRGARLLAPLLLLAMLLTAFSGAIAPATRASQQRDATPGAAPESLAQQWVVPDGLPKLPATSAKTVFVGDVDTGQVLYAQHADEHRAPASTAKIASVLTVMDILTNLNQQVTIQQGDTVDITIYSNAQLQTGDKVTVEELLYGLMLPSGNDAAKALARVAGQTLDPSAKDPVATFLDAVKKKVAALGATNTNILDPAGEDTDGQYTSARDLAVLGAALLDNDELAKIVQTQTHDMQVTGDNARTVTLTNTNELLSEDGIIGIKTGSTSTAGACLVTGALVSGDRVIIVVMGSDITYDANNTVTQDSRFDDTLAIIGALFKDYMWLDLTQQDAVKGLSEELAAWQVKLPSGSQLVVPTAKASDVTYQLILEPAASSGEDVGHVLFFLGDSQVADLPVQQI